MIAKGAWKHRPVIVREARQTNEHDVRIQKIRSIEANFIELQRKSKIDKDTAHGKARERILEI